MRVIQSLSELVPGDLFVPYLQPLAVRQYMAANERNPSASTRMMLWCYIGMMPPGEAHFISLCSANFEILYGGHYPPAPILGWGTVL